MSALSFAIPKEYGYVLGTATATFLVTIWHGSYSIGRRKLAGIKYPAQYAPTWTKPGPEDKLSAAERDQKNAEYAFNCAQRAHAQYLENIPIFLPALLISGLRWPVASSALGMAWLTARVVYTLGYVKSSKPHGAGRLYGGPYAIIQVALAGMCGKLAWDVVFT